MKIVREDEPGRTVSMELWYGEVGLIEKGLQLLREAERALLRGDRDVAEHLDKMIYWLKRWREAHGG